MYISYCSWILVLKLDQPTDWPANSHMAWPATCWCQTMQSTVVMISPSCADSDHLLKLYGVKLTFSIITILAGRVNEAIIYILFMKKFGYPSYIGVSDYIFLYLISLSLSLSLSIDSSQTLNSAVLARARMRAELASDHTHQLYTYCQDYHSMTFEPADHLLHTKQTQRY